MSKWNSTTDITFEYHELLTLYISIKLQLIVPYFIMDEKGTNDLKPFIMK